MRWGTAAHVEGQVSKYRRCKRLQDRKNALRQHTLRELACFYGKDPSAETRPLESFGARRADALAALAESYLAAEPQNASGADRYQVVVHVSAETLQSESREGDVSAEISHPFQADLCHLCRRCVRLPQNGFVYERGRGSRP